MNFAMVRLLFLEPGPYSLSALFSIHISVRGLFIVALLARFYSKDMFRDDCMIAATAYCGLAGASGPPAEASSALMLNTTNLNSSSPGLPH
jgi:hypothetical protein